LKFNLNSTQTKLITLLNIVHGKITNMKKLTINIFTSGIIFFIIKTNKIIIVFFNIYNTKGSVILDKI